MHPESATTPSSKNDHKPWRTYGSTGSKIASNKANTKYTAKRQWQPRILFHKTSLAFAPSTNAIEIPIGTLRTTTEQTGYFLWRGCVDVSLRVTPRRRHIRIPKDVR